MVTEISDSSVSKLFVVIRKDLNLKRSDIINIIAKCSVRFLSEEKQENTSKNYGHISFELSLDEMQWLYGEQLIDARWADNHSSLDDILFKSNFLKEVVVYPIYRESEVIAFAAGPSKSKEIFKLISKLSKIT